MRYHVVVSRSVNPIPGSKYEARILDENGAPFVNYSFDGDSRAEAIGKAIVQHPELFPGLVERD